MAMIGRIYFNAITSCISSTCIQYFREKKRDKHKFVVDRKRAQGGGEKRRTKCRLLFFSSFFLFFLSTPPFVFKNTFIFTIHSFCNTSFFVIYHYLFIILFIHYYTSLFLFLFFCDQHRPIPPPQNYLYCYYFLHSAF